MPKVKIGNFKGPIGATGAAGATGPVGAQGPMGPTGKTGAMGASGAQGVQGTSFKYQGAWAVNKTYVNNIMQIDTISYEGETYACIKTHTSTTSIMPSDAVYWTKIAAKGNTGATGATGAMGPTAVRLDNVIQSVVDLATARAATPPYVHVQVISKDRKVLSFETEASNVIVKDGDMPLTTVLNSVMFKLTEDATTVTFGNFTEWVAAGKPKA